MKNVLLLIIVLALTLTSASCSNGGTDIGILGDNDEIIADKTFNKIITTIGSNDDSTMVNMFSNIVKSEVDLSHAVLLFYDFIQGDIVSFSSASEAGVGADYQTESGKIRKEIQSAFCISTTENTYYIAIKECVKEEIDDNNIGIVSIYIMESNNWKEDHVYCGDGEWLPGINIVTPS